MSCDPALDAAAAAIAEARSLVVAAGAGMGVDSGLPDFRGDTGFWTAYPPFRELGLSFVDLANPRWFDRDPSLAWGFYGHRMHLYRDVKPHSGFHLLKKWSEALPGGAAVFTSNVDAQFQRAGFTTVCEVHGSIHHLQCAMPCSDDIWWAKGVQVPIDEATFRAQEPLPRCSRCGGLARPNVLMFGDGTWLPDRTGAQEHRLEEWLAEAPDPIVVVECGAGTAVPTVRWFSERLARGRRATLVRINPRESQGPAGTISIPMGAAPALSVIDERLQAREQ
jgi:NAD-dependent SIR2 family protein deacetylase